MSAAQGTSGVSHDFNFYNADNEVWNGSAFVAWADGDYAAYRVAATESGTSGRFPLPTPPAGTTSWEMRVRGASLALSYVVWDGIGPRQTRTTVSDTTSSLTEDVA